MSTVAPVIRHDWTCDEVNSLFELSFNDLLFRAQSTHRVHFPAEKAQISTLLRFLAQLVDECAAEPAR